MRITVIRVSMFEGKSYDAMKPLIFPIIAGLTPEDITLEFIDDRVEELPESIDSDVIAFSADIFSAKRAYILAKKLKTRDNITVIGGFHPTVLPKESAIYCDVVIVGDAEDTWPEFIRDLKNKEVKNKYISHFNTPFREINVNHCSFTGKSYQKIGITQFSRGCKYNCDFCSIKAMYKGSVRQKDTGSIVQELKNSKEKLFFFSDDNIFYDEASAYKLLKEMKESGCFLVLIGFESLNIKNLEQMNKRANLEINDYEKAIYNIYSHGLLIYATFVLGYDYDTPKTIKETVRFALKHNFTIANFNPLIPMPGTLLYQRLKKENRLIFEKWWLSNNYKYGDTAFYPKNLTPEELMTGCREARYTFYSTYNIFKRLAGNKLHWNLKRFFIYLIANAVSKKEIHRKQGRLLGGRLSEAYIDKA